METMVEVSGLHKSFRRADGTEFDAVKSIDLEIFKGEIFGLLGPNGAGKTTMLSMISGLLSPTSGDARIGGHSITRDPLAAKQLIGFVPQEIALYPELNARQNLAFFGKLYGLSGKELNSRIDEVLDFIDLTDRQGERVETFSGGMKRRVNIGVGLLHRPQLLYMDEPTAGIDPQNRRRILDTVKYLRDEEGVTILYTTHMMEEAQELSDRVAIIDHGEIIALGAQDELTRQVGEEDRLDFKVSCEAWSEELTASLQHEVAGLSHVTYMPPEEVAAVGDGLDLGELTVYAPRGRQALPDIIRIVDAAGVDVYSVEIREPDLEAVFLALTGRALRD